MNKTINSFSVKNILQGQSGQDEVAGMDDQSHTNKNGVHQSRNQFMNNTMKMGDQNFNLANIKNETNLEINFLRKLCNMTNRVQVYRDNFGLKKPIFEKIYLDRKQKIDHEEMDSLSQRELRMRYSLQAKRIIGKKVNMLDKSLSS